MTWASHVNEIVELAVVSVFGFGIAFLLGSTFLGALTAGSAAANAVTAIIGAFASGITTVFVPIIAVIFVIVLYMIVKGSGILNTGKKGMKR